MDLTAGWNLALTFHPVHQVGDFPDYPSDHIFIMYLWKRHPPPVIMLLHCRSMTADFISVHLFFTCPTLRPLPPTAFTESAMCCHISFLFSITPFWKCEVNNSFSFSISSNKVTFSKSLHFVFYSFRQNLSLSRHFPFSGDSRQQLPGRKWFYEVSCRPRLRTS